MPHITVAVHGLGNIGKKVLESLEAAPDMRCLGVLRRASSLGTESSALRGVPAFTSLTELAKAQGQLPQVVIVCGPSRAVPADAAAYLAAGVNTVDSFDIHQEIPPLVKKLHEVSVAQGRVSISGAGWDPGTDSVFRALFEAMAPSGTTFTNFGLGRSMGHSVAVRAMPGVADAASLTIPMGGGRHSRLVYVLPQSGMSEGSIREAIAADPYFKNDPLEVRFVRSPEELARVADNSHGVLMERTGASGLTSNQRLQFDMRIDNPAMTASVLVACARATTKLAPGAYTMIDVPPVALLPGERMDHVARLV